MTPDDGKLTKRTGPYRALPVVGGPPLVFCKSCVHFERKTGGTHVCHAHAPDSDPITGDGNPVNRNAKLDCAMHIERHWLSRILG